MTASERPDTLVYAPLTPRPRPSKAGFACPRARTRQPPLRVVLCAPRGFCAGVVRAIDIVERAPQIYRAPVYVRREIVRDRFVIGSLETIDVAFVKDVARRLSRSSGDLLPHGVAKATVLLRRRIACNLRRRDLATG